MHLTFKVIIVVVDTIRDHQPLCFVFHHGLWPKWGEGVEAQATILGFLRRKLILESYQEIQALNIFSIIILLLEIAS